MITKNWYRLFTGQFTMTSANSLYTVKNVSGVVKNCPGANSTDMGGLSFSSAGSSLGASATPTSSCVVFGTGTTPPTADDFTLSGQAANLTRLSSFQEHKFSGDKIAHVKTFTVRNSGTTDVTICEAAWFGKLSSNTYLLDRTLLDNPVTIPAGEDGVLVYSITLDLPDEFEYP